MAVDQNELDKKNLKYLPKLTVSAIWYINDFLEYLPHKM